MKKNLNKWIIVSVLIVAVVLVIIQKNKAEKSETPQDGDICDTLLVVADDSRKEVLSELKTEPSQQQSEKQEKKESEQAEKQTEKNEISLQQDEPINLSVKKAEKDILALINNSQITELYFNERYNSLPEQYKDMFKNDKESLLDQMIIKELLFQKAKEKGIVENVSESDEEKLKDKAIEKLIIEISSAIEITDEEMKTFYHEHESDMKGAGFEQVKSDIRNYLVQQKQSEIMEMYIDELKNAADVVLNEEWVKVQQASKPKNPLTEALKNGKTTVLDMGASSCVPCKMMKPIFEELETEYEGKANILLLEISDYRDIANKYKVRVIPTQIFFDKNGIQYWRHEGFLSKEDIIKKINESGA